MPNMYKPMFALLVVTLVASFLLGVVFTVTEEPIRIQKEQTEMKAIESIMTGTSSTEPVEMQNLSEGSVITKITKCLDGGGNSLGYVVSVSPKGYGGAIDLMVGLSGDAAAEIVGIEIISHAETPGLGANADTVDFTDRYKGKESAELSVVKIGPAGEDEIQALASSTITTQAVTNGVNEALAYYNVYLLGGAEQ